MAQEPLKITDKGSHLFVEFFGEFSVAAGKECVNRMVEACAKHRHTRVLLDCRRMTGRMPLLHRFEVAEYGSTKSREIKKLALVNREDVVLPDNFVENVAVNRGLNMKIFTDLDEAVLWLSKLTSNKADAGDGR